MSSVHVIDDVLPPAAIEAVYTTVRSSGAMSTLFVDPDDPVAQLGESMPLPLALLLARYLERIHAESMALGYQPAATLEVWINVVSSLGPEVFLHVDNDEQLRKATGEVVPPEYGTILYLGPDGEVDGGETLIGREEPSDELLERVLFKQVPAEEVQTAVGDSVETVAPRRGRACIFKGSLAHCVLPFGELAGGPRITLLANGWVSPPSSATNGS